MSDKEKLIQLIKRGHDYYYSDDYQGAYVYEAIAEYLIKKGVNLKDLRGRLRGVTYEDGHITDVHIVDTDDVVKVFEPVRYGKWIDMREAYNDVPRVKCSLCDKIWFGLETNHCPNCGAKMDLDVKE